MTGPPQARRADLPLVAEPEPFHSGDARVRRLIGLAVLALLFRQCTLLAHSITQAPTPHDH